ncbi:baseplate J/gp47 family protein [Maritimibacter sp. HL-12]|uniref:baseplate assembly protein n=1 Tax=Maritimibacter sp. HL-12 TaxID=1162418 RepID=UPI000A0F2472|nr:baseplate J/gp47 family protein [Maritimibacter sp. HL-12]SMH35817.1 Phage-related baseplate assembly protein [Maritimibacter sp. HL-12]
MTGFSAIDLATLPTPEVIEQLDAEAIIAALKADVAARAPEVAAALDLESEPIIKILEAAAYRELLLRGRVNDAARAVMLATATGAGLENLAALLGVVRLAGETDDDLRGRIQLSLEGFSTAGPVGAYAYHALAAHADVKDVAVDSPTPGEVRVTVLSRDGDGVPGQEVLDAVAAALNADDVRPLCDTVEVEAATVTSYQVTAEMDLAPATNEADVLATAEAAVEAYVAAQHALGAQVSLSGLYAALHRPGVDLVDLTAPVATITAGPREAPYCTAITLTVAA